MYPYIASTINLILISPELQVGVYGALPKSLNPIYEQNLPNSLPCMYL